MITNKDEAIAEVGKKNPDMAIIDEKLLKDKDVVLAYIKLHSSNEILKTSSPININYKGMIDDREFIVDIIKNLEVGYSTKALYSLLKCSTMSIVKNVVNNGTDLNIDSLKEFAKGVMINYDEQVKLRCEQLREKEKLLKQLNDFIKNTNIESIPQENPDIDEIADTRYKRTDIGFTSNM